MLNDLQQLLSDLPAEQGAQLELRLLQRQGGPAKSVIPRRETFSPCILSFAQQRLWFLNQLAPDGFFFNNSNAFRLTGTVVEKNLQRAINAIVARHEAWRTTFDTVDGNPVQIITKDRSVSMVATDLSCLANEEKDVAVQRILREEAQRPFDLSQDSLLRPFLLRLSPTEHILFLVSHHIVSDRSSVEMFLRELSAFYAADCRGERIVIDTPLIQYADFAVWQRDHLQGKILQDLLSFWKQQLQGALALLELPTDHPRPAVQTFRGAKISLVVPKALTRALKGLSQQGNATILMTLLAAFKIVCYRYTGQETVVIGTSIAGRTHGGMDGVIGHVANTLVLRTDITPNDTFREVLGRVRRVVSEAFEHQEMPFDKLVEEIQPERTLSYNPLFQIMFDFRDEPDPVPQLPGLTVSKFPLTTETVLFDLSLSITDEGESLHGEFIFSADLYDEATIKRLGGHFLTVLRAAADNPDQTIMNLPLLTKGERDCLLVKWNQTDEATPLHDLCIHQLFEAQEQRTPDAVAVACDGQQLSYRELNRRANQLANDLIKEGVGPETLVGVSVERSLQLLVALLGILKAGGAYVFVEPTYPLERKNFILHDARPSIVLTQGALLADLSTNQCRLVDLDADWESISQVTRETPTTGVSLDNLAYVMYTSGSTGQPKGVMVCHRGVSNYLLWRQKTFPLTSKDRALQKTSVGFVDSVWELFEPLIVGACVMMAQPGGDRDPNYLLNFIAETEITAADFIPSMLSLFLEEPGVERCNCLRRVTTGSETVTVNLQGRFFARLNASLYNLYGPTEASIASTCWRCDPTTTLTTIPIGRPITNTQIYLLDHCLQPVPVGVPGEVYIGGSGLARGYLNCADLTSQKFVPDPFSRKPGSRLYKTGDLARYLPDGNMEFLGRSDHQVKIRGYRIELGEIETVLRQHSAVRDTIVLVREGNKRLTAYCVAIENQGITGAELRSYLKSKLPDYMIPSDFVLLDSLPLTTNGKVDRKALPDPDKARSKLEQGFVAPRTPTEKVLAEIWADVLKVERVGIYDNFFGLGGHSLMAIQLVTEIEKKLNKRLPLAMLFQLPTIEQLGEVLRTDHLPARSTLIPIQPNGSKPPFFLVHGEYAYARLAPYLDSDQPVYGLAQHLEGGKLRYTRIEDIAARCLEDVRAVQREGPYFIGGHSYGGLIAFELAQQLLQQGEKVALVALLDPSDTGESESVVKLGSVINKVRQHKANLAGRTPIERVRYVLKWLKGETQKRIYNPSKRLGCTIYHLSNQVLPPALEKFYIEDVIFQGIYRNAARNYRPSVYPGRMVYFFPEEQPRDTLVTFWQRLVRGGMEMHGVPGDHLTMLLEPHVPRLVEKLKYCLTKAQAGEYLTSLTVFLSFLLLE